MRSAGRWTGLKGRRRWCQELKMAEATAAEGEARLSWIAANGAILCFWMEDPPAEKVMSMEMKGTQASMRHSATAAPQDFWGNSGKAVACGAFSVSSVSTLCGYISTPGRWGHPSWAFTARPAPESDHARDTIILFFFPSRSAPPPEYLGTCSCFSVSRLPKSPPR